MICYGWELLKMINHLTSESIDFHRKIALKAIAPMRLLVSVQHSIEDITGAIEEGQFSTAKYQARNVILECLSIKSIAYGGEIFAAEEFDQLFFDPCTGLPELEISHGLILIDEILNESSDRWLDKVLKYTRETEAFLGFPDGLPLLRSQNGMQTVLRIIKDWDRLAQEFGLPSAIPKAWLLKY